MIPHITHRNLVSSCHYKIPEKPQEEVHEFKRQKKKYNLQMTIQTLPSFYKILMEVLKSSFKKMITKVAATAVHC